MIDFAAINDPLESTQRLPVLTPEVQRDEALRRERTARAEAAELFCQNAALVKEIALLRYGRAEPRTPESAKLAPAGQRHQDTEQHLFEVCGALKQTLSRVLAECQMRDLALNCGPASNRALHEACDTLERILSAPDSGISEPARKAAAPVDAYDQDLAPARVVSLELVRVGPTA